MRNRTLICMIAVAVALIITWLGVAQHSIQMAKTIHFPHDGPPIQSALDVIAPGGRVVVAPGMYYEALPVYEPLVVVVSISEPGETKIDGVAPATCDTSSEISYRLAYRGVDGTTTKDTSKKIVVDPLSYDDCGPQLSKGISMFLALFAVGVLRGVVDILRDNADLVILGVIMFLGIRIVLTNLKNSTQRRSSTFYSIVIVIILVDMHSGNPRLLTRIIDLLQAIVQSW